MEYRMEYVRGHIEVFSARGEFLFSADTMAEADEMLEELDEHPDFWSE